MPECEKITVIFPDRTRLKKSYETMVSYDFRKNTKFEVPVLFISGEEENICPPELLNDIIGDITAPVKKTEIISEATHGCFIDQPEIFMNILLSFTCEL